MRFELLECPMPRFTPLVADLPSTVPFVGPETQERASGSRFRARLGANENVFGPSPKAIRAMSDSTPAVWQYADPENHDLKTALAEFHGVSPSNIMIGDGIDGLLGLLVRMLVSEGTPVVTSLGAYPTFNFHVAGFGGKLITEPYKNDAEDPDAILASVQAQDAPLAYFANPDNPMGSMHGPEIVRTLINNIPADGLLCLDEAYCEFADADQLLPIDVSETRVVRMRTFSKAYGMAGARVGYAIGHEDLIDSFNKVRNHFGVNRVGQIGALAALEDQDWLNAVVGRVREANGRIAEIAKVNGLAPLPSHTNFVTIDCGGGEDHARALVAALARQHVFVRMPFVAPQSRCIRISAGLPSDLDYLEEALPKALDEVQDA